MGTNLRHSMYIETILKYSFYLLACPFVITLSTKKPELQIRKYFIHKCLCALTGVFAMYGKIIPLVYSLVKPVNTPVSCFQLCTRMLAVVQHLFFYKCLWTKQTAFRDIIKISQNIPHHLRSRTRKWLVTFLTVAICFTEISRSFLIIAANLTANIPPQNLSWKNGWKHVIQAGKHSLFISNIKNFNISSIGESEFTPTDICIGVAFVVIYLMSVAHTRCRHLLCTMATLTLWSAVADFCKVSLRKLNEILEMRTDEYTHNKDRTFTVQPHTCIVLESHSHQREKYIVHLRNSYNELKDMATNINKAVGELILFLPFLFCVDDSTGLQTIFSTRGWRNKLSWYMAGSQTIAFMVLSADICRKMDHIKNRIAKEQFRSQIFAKKDFKNLIGDMSLRHVSISGMGVFKIDFGFSFVVLSTTVTYFLIMFGQK